MSKREKLLAVTLVLLSIGVGARYIPYSSSTYIYESDGGISCINPEATTYKNHGVLPQYNYFGRWKKIDTSKYPTLDKWNCNQLYIMKKYIL